MKTSIAEKVKFQILAKLEPGTSETIRVYDSNTNSYSR